MDYSIFDQKDVLQERRSMMITVIGAIQDMLHHTFLGRDAYTET